MHFIDLLIIIFLIVAVNRGYRRGFILQFISLISVIAAVAIAYMFYPIVAKIIRPFFNMQELHEMFSLPIPLGVSVNEMAATAIAFALLFIGSRIGLMVFARTLDVVCRLPVLNTFNRILGLMLSFAEFMIITVIAVNIGAMLPIEAIQNIIEQSIISQYVMAEFGFVREKIISLLQEAII
ncbi:CvpA family protein [Desulfuribacillus alkaliarsenatis]|uniref:Colicin V production protein n=1 Tax=Desulfuribacillus alkaliarsenatis TaxID=766136 RepID=A0A1E5FYH1_9FIRM|nr:CvpA family protein [Desulfuribacillus alkaliarsenatis]OEF95619.1 hypothetical protein BHF68_12305 [Desulfuribacillus alkaliarsenatis]